MRSKADETFVKVVTATSLSVTFPFRFTSADKHDNLLL